MLLKPKLEQQLPEPLLEQLPTQASSSYAQLPITSWLSQGDHLFSTVRVFGGGFDDRGRGDGASSDGGASLTPERSWDSNSSKCSCPNCPVLNLGIEDVLSVLKIHHPKVLSAQTPH